MRFSSLLDRTEAKELTQEAASEILGINVRTFQRWAERYEAVRAAALAYCTTELNQRHLHSVSKSLS
jgi:hypothetical protein